jgi:hypothetical protein
MPACLFAKQNAKCQASGVRRTNILTNDPGNVAHFLQDSNCRRIHIEQSHLLSARSAEALDDDCTQESSLSRFNQVWRHAYGRRIF